MNAILALSNICQAQALFNMTIFDSNLVKKTLLLLKRGRNGPKVTPYNHFKLVKTQFSHCSHQKGGEKDMVLL